MEPLDYISSRFAYSETQAARTLITFLCNVCHRREQQCNPSRASRPVEESLFFLNINNYLGGSARRARDTSALNRAMLRGTRGFASRFIALIGIINFYCR